MARLDAIGIVCADIAASVRFYRILGLVFPENTEDHIEASTPSGMRVMLDKLELIRQLDPDWVAPVGRPMALAFLCASPKEVDETYAKVTRAGFRGKTPPFDAFWGQRYATVLDPDGNGVDLFAELPKS
jgi:catechol 2,3-dioxygenase-like lactoylglutathione lyase family enzyme